MATPAIVSHFWLPDKYIPRCLGRQDLISQPILLKPSLDLKQAAEGIRIIMGK